MIPAVGTALWSENKLAELLWMQTVEARNTLDHEGVLDLSIEEK